MLAKIEELFCDKYLRVAYVLLELLFFVEGRPCLSPLAPLDVINVISALCLPIATRPWFLVLEAAIGKVGVEVKYLGNLHSVNKFISLSDWLVTYQPVTGV